MFHLAVNLLCCLALVSINKTLAAEKQALVISDAPAVSPVHEQANLFAEMVNNHPLARELELKPSRAESDIDLVNQLRDGELDIAIIDSELERIDGKFGFFDLPMLFDTAKEVEWAIVKGPLIAEIIKRAGQKANLEVLGAYGNGFTHLVTVDRRISNAQDFKGVKVQIKPSEKRKKMFQALGAEPIEMRSPAHALKALRSGEVDAVELNIFELYSLRKEAHGLTLNLTKHAYIPSLIAVSPQFWRELTPKQREAFIMIGQEISDRAFKLAQSQEREYLEELSQTMVIQKVDRESIRRNTQTTYKTFMDKYRLRWFELLELGKKHGQQA